MPPSVACRLVESAGQFPRPTRMLLPGQLSMPGSVAPPWHRYRGDSDKAPVSGHDPSGLSASPVLSGRSPIGWRTDLAACLAKVRTFGQPRLRSRMETK